jgi:hypothetical protein
MYSKFLFICLCSLVHLFTTPADETITWSEKRFLTWTDFTGKPLPSTPNAALSQVSILPHAEATGEELTFEVSAIFTPAQSWVRADKMTPYLLKHEQDHFDIGELFARKMRKELAQKVFVQKTFSADYKTITGRISAEFLKFTEEYDLETKHSLVKEKQEQWDIKIAKGLKELDAFKESHFTGKLNP